MSSEIEISDISEKVKELAELSKTIKLIQEKLKILNKKKKNFTKKLFPNLKQIMLLNVICHLEP